MPTRASILVMLSMVGWLVGCSGWPPDDADAPARTPASTRGVLLDSLANLLDINDEEAGVSYDSLQRRRTYHLDGRRGTIPFIIELDPRWTALFDVEKESGLLVRKKDPAAVRLPWQNVGVNTSGKIAAYAFDPRDPRTLWVASASGGLWKTTDGADRWEPVTDHLPAVVINTIAVHPQRPDTVLIGALDDFGDQSHHLISAAPGVVGYGVLRSTDGGRTWGTTSLFPPPEPMDAYALVWHPVRPDTVYLAASNGLWRSTDAGKHWGDKPLFEGVVKTAVINPQTPQIIYIGVAASTQVGYAEQGVYRSTDDGQTWTSLTQGLPAPRDYRPGCGVCVSLAIAESDPAVLYLTAQLHTKEGQSYDRVYKTVDGGASWRSMLTSVDLRRRTGATSETIWFVSISPVNPDVVYVGGIHLFRSTDGLRRWEEVGRLKDLNPLYTFMMPQAWADWLFRLAQRAFAHPDSLSKEARAYFESHRPAIELLYLGSKAHVDHHAVGFDPDRPDSVVYDFSDGGVFVSTDGGAHWTPKNSGLMTLQIYRMASALTDPSRVVAATQDQGLLITLPDSLAHQAGTNPDSLVWRKWNGGDGATALFSNTSADTVYGAAAMGMYWRFAIPPDSALARDPLGILNLTTTQRKQRIQVGIAGTRRGKMISDPGQFIPPLVMNPRNSRGLFTADKNYVYATTDGGESWTSLLRIDSVSVLAVDWNDSTTVYAYSNRRYAPTLWRLRKRYRSDTWEAYLLAGPPALQRLREATCRDPAHTAWPLPWPAPYLNDLEADPDETGTLYAVRTDYCYQVWRSTDHGETWVDIVNNLPPIPVNTITVTPDSTVERKQVYVGTDVGVYMAYAEADPAKIRWRRVEGGLPLVVVNDLHVHPVDKTLRVATYGRGYWKATLHLAR